MHKSFTWSVASFWHFILCMLCWQRSAWKIKKNVWCLFLLIGGQRLQGSIPLSALDPIPTYPLDLIKEWTVIIFRLGKTIFPRRNAKRGQTFTYLLDIHVEYILNGERVVFTAVVLEVTGPVQLHRAWKISRTELRHTKADFQF